MTNFLKTFTALVTGLGLGLLATWFAVERGAGFGAVRAGAWTGWPKSGSPNADPYARAEMSRTGELPLGNVEGLSFVARTDSAGARLDPRCEYRVRGPVPPSRWWTLSAMTPDGRLLDTPARIFGLTSAELTRNSEGEFEIIVASQARPGNWLPVAGAAKFILSLRLYDTTVTATKSSLSASLLPQIVRGACA